MLDAPEQLQLDARCSRCGRPLVALEELARTAIEAEAALRTMRIALPDALTWGVRALARGLPCHAGSCSPEAAR